MLNIETIIDSIEIEQVNIFCLDNKDILSENNNDSENDSENNNDSNEKINIEENNNDNNNDNNEKINIEENIDYKSITNLNLIQELNKDFSIFEYTHPNFIESLFKLIDKDFITYTKNEINETINNFRKKIAFDLDEKNLYYKLKYNYNKQIVKANLIKLLLNIDNNIDTFDICKRYIINYLNINLVIIENNDIEELYINSLSYDNPIIFFSKVNNKFYPYINDKCSIITDKTYPKLYNYTKKIIIDKKANEEKYKSCKVIELQKICNQNKIPLKKISEKSKRLISKNKNELINDIYLFEISI